MKIRNTLLSLVLFSALSAGAVFIAGSFDSGVATADTPPSVPAADPANAGQQVEVDDAMESDNENEAVDQEEVGDHDDIQDEQGDDSDGDDAETAADQAALAKRATVTEAQAIAAASAKVAGKVVKVELEDEAGVVLYSIEFDNGQDAEVNATTGAVLKVEADNSNN